MINKLEVIQELDSYFDKNKDTYFMLQNVGDIKPYEHRTIFKLTENSNNHSMNILGFFENNSEEVKYAEPHDDNTFRFETSEDKYILYPYDTDVVVI